MTEATALLGLAWRLVWGRPKRACLAIASVAIGTAVVAIVLAALAGFAEYLFDRATGTLLGDVIITSSRDVASRRTADVFDPEPALARLAATLGSGARVTTRVIVPVLVGAEGSERAAFLYGIDAAAEARLSPDVAELDALERAPAGGDEPAPVLLSSVQAEALGLHPGDLLELVARDRFGLPRGARARVAGLFRAASRDVEAFVVLAPRGLAETLLDAHGLVHEVALALPPAERSLEHLPAAVSRVGAGLPGTPALFAEPWTSVSPAIVDYVNVNVAVYRVFLVLEVLLVALAVADILWLGLEERLRDLGTVGALGASPRALVGLVLAQAAWLLGIGVLMGAVLGAAVAIHLTRAGIPGLDAAAAFSVGGFSIGDGVRGRFEASQVVIAASVVLGAGLIAAVLPAWRAWRLEPVAALRHR
ncbi:MAG: FtsX-like permease family protein [bacterium]